MRPPAIAAAVFLAVQGVAAPAALAQEPGEIERLLKIIDGKQRQLDAQEVQLAEQKRVLEELREQVEALQGGGERAKSPATQAAGQAAAPSYPGLPSGKPEEKKAAPYPGLEGATAAAAQKEWPGSFGVKGIATRFKISGFAEADVLHDDDAILTPSAFVTKSILTRDSAASQVTNPTNFSVQATRLALETRTPLRDRRLTTFVAVDFFGDFAGTTPQLRLRQAYGELTGILFGGDLLFGQDWSTFTNLYSIPNTLDYQTPNAVFGTRHPLMRWTKGVGSGWVLKLAVEAPDLRAFEDADPVSTWPDGVAALGWQNDLFNLQASFLARDLRAKVGDGSVTSAFAWGASLAGRIHMPGALKQDFWTFSVTDGEGIGGVVNDIPPDASYDPAANALEAIPTLAWLVGYQHWWSPRFYSVASYGEVRQSNRDFQEPSAYRKTRYCSLNVTWTPFVQWLFGVEALYGMREDKDGTKGDDVRLQFTSRYTF